MKSGDASLRVECKACGATFKMTVRGAELEVRNTPCPRCDAPLDLKSQWDTRQASGKKSSVPMAGVISRKRKTTPKSVEAGTKQKPGGLGFHIKQQAGRDVVSTPIRKSPIDPSALGRLSPTDEMDRKEIARWSDPDESAELPAVVSRGKQDEEPQKRTLPIPSVKTVPLPMLDGPSEEPGREKLPTLSIPKPGSKSKRPVSRVEPDDDPTVQHSIQSLLDELNSQPIDSIEVVDDEFAELIEKDEDTDQITANEHEELIEALRERRASKGAADWDPVASDYPIDSVTIGEPIFVDAEHVDPSEGADNMQGPPVPEGSARGEAGVDGVEDGSSEPFEDPEYRLESSGDDENWAWREEADERDFDDEPPVSHRRNPILGLAVALFFCVLAVIFVVVFFS